MDTGIICLSTVFCAVQLLLLFIGGLAFFVLPLLRMLTATQLRNPAFVPLVEVVAFHALFLIQIPAIFFLVVVVPAMVAVQFLVQARGTIGSSLLPFTWRIQHVVSKRQIVLVALFLSLRILLLLGLDQIVFLPDHPDELLRIDAFLWVLVSLVHMPLDKGIGERVPGPRKWLCDNAFEKCVAYQLVMVTKQGQLIPAFLQLSQMLRDIGALCHSDLQSDFELICIHHIIGAFVYWLEIIPHLVGRPTSLSMYLLRWGGIVINT